MKRAPWSEDMMKTPFRGEEMSKRLDLQVVVSGVLDGTLQSAIQNATGMLNRLKGASKGRMNFNTDSLSRALTELQKIQAGAEESTSLQSRTTLGASV